MIQLRLNIDKILNFLISLFVFVLILDPADQIIGLKQVLFFLTVVFCFVVFYPRILNKAVIILLALYILLILTTLLGFFSKFDYDPPMGVFVYKGYLLLILLCWIEKIMILRKLFFPSIILSIIVISIYFTCILYPDLNVAIYSLVILYFDKTLMMSKRSFIGIDVFSVYYNSLPILLLPFSVVFFKYLNDEKQKIFNLLYSILFGTTLIMGGTRACMFSLASLLFILILWKMSNSKRLKFYVLPLSFVLLFCGIFLILALLNDTDEVSNNVKHRLAGSFLSLINDNPGILITGQGVGAMFDTGSVRGLASQSEWTYLEVIRWFGLIGGGLFMSIYLYPLYLIYSKRQVLKYSFPLSISYVFYLFVAGTNPLLWGSNGLLVLLVMYNYALNSSYKNGI